MGRLTDSQYRRIAQEQYHRDGEVEIDDGAVVSQGEDPGAYVQAWIWVADQLVNGLTYDQQLQAETWMTVFAEHYTNARQLSQGCGENLHLEDPIGETFLADDLYDMARAYFVEQPEEDQ